MFLSRCPYEDMTMTKGLAARIGGVALCALLTGCATAPTGPTVAVMPAANKNFDAFLQDQAVHDGGKHADIISSCFIHAQLPALRAPENVAAPDNYCHLHA